MQNRKTKFGMAILFLGIGAIVGAITFRLFFLYSVNLKTYAKTFPETFGDIKIWTARPPSSKFRKDHDISKMMLVAKGDRPFLSLRMNKTGKVTHLSLLGEDGKLRFTITASKELGKWEHAIYAGEGDGDYFVGEMFTDIDFDGQFDVKRVYDDTGKQISQHIYYNNIWETVEHGDLQKAISGQTKYRFDANSGWCEE